MNNTPLVVDNTQNSAVDAADINNFISHLPFYKISDMAEYCNADTSPLQTVYLHPLRPEVNHSFTLKEALDSVFGYGIDSDNRMFEILRLVNRISGGFSQRLKFIKRTWSAAEDLYQDGGTINYRLGDIAEHIDFRSAFTAEEKVWFDGLGDKFTIYRGCLEDRIDGLSWTTDRAVAESYAAGYQGLTESRAVVVSAICDADEVLLALNDIDEFEIVVHPQFLENVWVDLLPLAVVN